VTGGGKTERGGHTHTHTHRHTHTYIHIEEGRNVESEKNKYNGEGRQRGLVFCLVCSFVGRKTREGGGKMVIYFLRVFFVVFVLQYKRKREREKKKE
jgi:hypothetical protein